MPTTQQAQANANSISIEALYQVLNEADIGDEGALHTYALVADPTLNRIAQEWALGGEACRQFILEHVAPAALQELEQSALLAYALEQQRQNSGPRSSLRQSAPRAFAENMLEAPMGELTEREKQLANQLIEWFSTECMGPLAEEIFEHGRQVGKKETEDQLQAVEEQNSKLRSLLHGAMATIATFRQTLSLHDRQTSAAPVYVAQALSDLLKFNAGSQH